MNVLFPLAVIVETTMLEPSRSCQNSFEDPPPVVKLPTTHEICSHGDGPYLHLSLSLCIYTHYTIPVFGALKCALVMQKLTTE